MTRKGRQRNHIINRIIKTMWWFKDKCLILSKSETLTGVHRWQGFKKRWQEEIRLLVQSSGSHYLHILSYNALLCLLTFQTAARTDSWDPKHTLKIWYSRGTYAGSMWHCVCVAFTKEMQEQESKWEKSDWIELKYYFRTHEGNWKNLEQRTSDQYTWIHQH